MMIKGGVLTDNMLQEKRSVVAASSPVPSARGGGWDLNALVQSLPYDYTFVLDAKSFVNVNDSSPSAMAVSFLYGCEHWNKLLGEEASLRNVLSTDSLTEFVRLCRLVTVRTEREQVELSVTFRENAAPEHSPEYWDMTLFPVFLETDNHKTRHSPTLSGVGGLIRRSTPSATKASPTNKIPPNVDMDDSEVIFSRRNYLREIVDTAAAETVLLDREGVILESSSSFHAKVKGHTVDPIKDEPGKSSPTGRGKILWDLSLWRKPESLEKLKSAVCQVFDNGTDARREVVFREEVSSAQEWMEYRVSCAFIEQDQIQAVLVEGRDVTEQVRAELEYQERKDYYQGLFQHMPTGYALHDIVTHPDGQRDFRFLEVNPQFESLTGLENVVGKCVTELLPNIREDPADWIGRVCRVADEGVVDRFSQFSVPLKKWYTGISYSPARGKCATLFLDMTEQEEMNRALKESEEKHGHLFETMNQGVTYASADGSYSNANQAALKMMGLTIDQFQGRSSIDPRWNTIREDGTDWPSEEHPINDVFRTGKPVTDEVMGVFNPQEGQYRWMSVDLIPRFRPGETSCYQVCAILTDITEAKQVKSALLHAKEKAEEADNLKSAFLATMSHEIRTPLNGIIGNLDLILSSGLDESHRDENLEGLKVAMQSSRLLISIIEDILDLSKIEAGQLDISREPMSITKVIDHTMQLAGAYQVQRKKAHVKLSQKVEPLPSEYVFGDEFRLQQILVNLVSNAIKFTEEGSVTLLVTCDNTNISFCVKDTGKGIPHEKLGIIFDPFRQVELSDTREHGGTGLGLTICRKLVELMGGSLTVESSVSGPDRGSKFYVSLPFDATTEKRVPKGHGSGNDLWKSESILSDRSDCRKILIAEDDPVSRRIVSKMLEKAGQEFLVAKDGLEAVKMFSEHRSEIALALMDVMMPGMDGLEASKRIRQIESETQDSRHTPIIALSAGAMKGDREKGIEFGMTDYLTKPISYKDLVSTLDFYLGETEERG